MFQVRVLAGLPNVSRKHNAMTNTRLAAIGYVVLGLLTGLFLEHVLLLAFGSFGPTQPLTRPLLGADWTWSSIIGLGIAAAAGVYLWRRPDTHEVSLEIVAELRKVTWTSLEEKIRQEKLGDFFGDILIPMENVVEMVKGEKRASKRKFFPGYILVQMELNDRTWHLVKNTPKITGFVGNATKPPAVSEHEIARLTTQLSEGALKPKPKVEFEEGDNVRVVDGPFSNFNGTVEEVNPDKGRVRVLVSIFGRATPVELDFMQVEKT